LWTSTIFSYRYCTHAEGERKGRKGEGKKKKKGNLSQYGDSSPHALPWKRGLAATVPVLPNKALS
jgi:hypothetical protein